MGGADGHVEERQTGMRAFETVFALAALAVAAAGFWYALRSQQPQILFPAAVLTLLLASIAVLPGWSRSVRRRV